MIDFPQHQSHTEHDAGVRLRELGLQVLDRLRSAPELDEEPDDLSVLASVARVQWLRANLQRVQRIIATDEWMSATRQIANRMAYGQLLDDFEDMLAHEPPGLTYSPVDDENAPVLPMPADLVTSPDSQHRPTVEILDFDWRSR